MSKSVAVHADSWLGQGDPTENRSGALAGELFEQHAEMVLSVCRVLLLDPADAEDALQQTFFYAYRSILAGSEPRQPAAWLATIARNECLNRIRARTREPLAEPVSPNGPGGPDALDAAIAREDLDALGRTIAALPAQQRDALVLHEFCGLPYSEVAATIGVSESAIGSLLFRARTRLRSALHRAYASLPLPALWDAVDHLLARGPATTSAVPVVARLGTAAVAVGLTASAAVVVDHSVQSHHRAPTSPPARFTSPATPPTADTHVRRAAVATHLPSAHQPPIVPPSTRTHRHTASPARTSHEARHARAAATGDHESQPSAPPISVPEPHGSGTSPQTRERSGRTSPRHGSARDQPANGKGKGRRSRGRPSEKTQSNAAPKSSKHAPSPGSTADPSIPAHGNGTPHENTGAPSEPQQHGNGAESNGGGDHGNSHAHQGH